MHVLTLIAPPAAALTDAALNRAHRHLKPHHSDWLTPGEAADLFFETPPTAIALAEALQGAAIDAVLQPAQGRRKRLLLADMDSTAVTTETLDELAAHAGLKNRIAAITARSMNGEIDFRQALIERVGLLRGLDVAALDATWAETRIMPGAAALVATMAANGAVCALISGGFTWFTSRVAQTLGFTHHRANVLLVSDGQLTGAVAEPILDRSAKRAALHELAAAQGIPLAATLAVGDGANDLEMIGDAGMGVAYHAKPIVAQAARARIDHCDLSALLFLQGYPRSAWAGT